MNPRPKGVSEAEVLTRGASITNREWMTIARNVENVNSNWNTSIVGSGFMYSGHNDYGMDGGVDNAGALNASSDDDGYYRTGDSSTVCDGSYYNFVESDDLITGRACLGQRRTLNLNNGEIIWDLAGNVWEWTNDIITCEADGTCNTSTMPFDSTPATQWIEYTNIETYGSLSSLLLKPTDTTLNANNGIGRLYTDIDTSYPIDSNWNTKHAFLRGGYWFYGAHAGAFALYLNNGPSYSGTFIGFRCSYAP